MIKIIYGSKGTGKTKMIIDAANVCGEKSEGDVVFLSDTSRYVRDIKYVIRFVNTVDNEINSADALLGFIKGLIAGNYDIKNMFIDGATRMINVPIDDMGAFMEELDKIAKKSDVNFTLTVSRDLAEMPKFFLEFIK